jgi:hypothetical protein
MHRVCLGIISSLMIMIFCTGCTDDILVYFGSSVKTFPPNTSCKIDNPHAEFDESIIELCDGIDNNCDCLALPPEEQDSNGDLVPCGFGDIGVDEGCECWPKDKEYSIDWAISERTCWLDEEGRDLGLIESHSNQAGRLYGECKFGKQICQPLPAGGSQWGIFDDGHDTIGGTEDDVWSPGGCIGAVGPHTEVCDGKDNNCDAHTDEGLKKICWSGPSDPDGTPQDWLVFVNPSNSYTLCKTGVELCENGRWSGCMHEVLPESEVCDGLDNDCDGVVDDHPEYEGDQCGLTDAGICDYGQLMCSRADLLCEDALYPQTEECDSIDNDCDGATDEDLFQPCQTICGSGIETCNSGNWVNCNALQPQEEVCDGEDNDCDGLVDEELLCMCPAEFLGMLLPCQSNPRLVCGAGFMECVCTNPDCTETAFTECQALCAYEPQVQEECDPTLGTSSPEVCNAWDDDCDQIIDEGLFAACYTGPPGTANVGICAPGQLICRMGRWGNETNSVFIDGLCAGQILPEEEVCNRIDDDCDGDVDEDLDSHEKVDMVFAIDRSGSMCSKIRALREGIQPYVLEFANTPHRFALVNIPGKTPVPPGQGNIWQNPPDVEINLVDSLAFANSLAGLGCDLNNLEPQYDAVVDIAQNTLNLSFRNDAWPMIVVLSDEPAQTFRNLGVPDVIASIDPCTVGNCEVDDKLEVYSIIPERYHVQWCSPADIAKKCYNLHPTITSGEVRAYLDDIFSDVCR